MCFGLFGVANLVVGGVVDDLGVQKIEESVVEHVAGWRDLPDGWNGMDFGRILKVCSRFLAKLVLCLATLSEMHQNNNKHKLTFHVWHFASSFLFILLDISTCEGKQLSQKSFEFLFFKLRQNQILYSTICVPINSTQRF